MSFHRRIDTMISKLGAEGLARGLFQEPGQAGRSPPHRADP
jgi:hypothetical protein